MSSLHAQVNHSYKQTAEFIQKKVSCCSVPFAASSNAKVDSIAIELNGATTLYYSDKRGKNIFNLFELYKENQWETGIDTILKGKFVQFFISEKRARLIRFATAQDAKEVYQAFSQLIKPGKNEKKMFSDLNFAQTVDVINIRLSKWTEKGNHIKVIAFADGTVTIVNKSNQFFRFNLFELIPPDNDKWWGIETISCDPRSHAPIAWINFNTLRGTAAFLRLQCSTPEPELHIIRNAFLHLRSLCKNSNSSYTRPNESIYFVNRNAVINTNNKMLALSIRSIDKKDEEDTTLSINSNGEGWLDKDSLPVGEWKFYATDNGGKEYLFKSGIYEHTNPDMFEVKGIDSSDFAKNYHLSFRNLQVRQVQIIPFVKSGKWNYYHSNASLWKTVYYINNKIPITIGIVLVDPEKNDPTRLIVELKDRLDEWADEKK